MPDEPDGLPPEPGMTRLETFVDAAFAFAVTLLVLNTEKVPTSFAELVEALKGIPAFLASFATLALFWLSHRDYTRRFPDEGGAAVPLSLLLIAVMLVFVYPLKFVFTQGFAFFVPQLRTEEFKRAIQTTSDLTGMFMVYGAGFAAFHLIVLLMFRDGLRRSGRVSGRLRIEAEGSIRDHAICIGVAGLSLGLSLLAMMIPSRTTALLPGFSYCVLGILMPWSGMKTRRAVQGL